MTTIVYASAGGATRHVVTEMAHWLGPGTRLIDLATFDWRIDWSLRAGELVIAGGPTYGSGDWHHLWSSHFGDVAPMLVTASHVALFGLGDSRFHGDTFCGGLGKLHGAVTALGVTPAGSTTPGRHPYRSTPSLHDGMFPGLVVDYRLDRRSLKAITGDWLNDLSSGGRQRAPLQYRSTSTLKEDAHHVASQYPDRRLNARTHG